MLLWVTDSAMAGRPDPVAPVDPADRSTRRVIGRRLELGSPEAERQSLRAQGVVPATISRWLDERP